MTRWPSRSIQARGWYCSGVEEIGAAGEVEAVVDEDVGGEFARESGEFDRVPVVAAFAAAGASGWEEVVPDDVDRAVVGEEFADLAVEVVAVAGEVAIGVGGAGGVVIALGVDGIDGEVGVVPSRSGSGRSKSEAFGAEGVDEGAEEVAPGGGVGGFVVGERGVPEAEAFVVLGGEDDVLHAGGSGVARPGGGVVEVGVEVAEVAVVVGVVKAFAVLDPFVAGGRSRPQWMKRPKQSWMNQAGSRGAGVGGMA